MDDESQIHGFDFLFSRWNVHHRRLAVRGQGSDDWREFEGTSETRPLLGGLCNIEEHVIPGQEVAGIALRTFDRAAKQWSIYWVAERDGLIQPPVVGGFKDGVGIFEGDDVDGGRPVRVRFLWRDLPPDKARWEQAFSYDGGASWETNWIMDFDRRSD
jgi:hypothetical protein